jgi:hypothetical protein
MMSSIFDEPMSIEVKRRMSWKRTRAEAQADCAAREPLVLAIMAMARSNEDVGVALRLACERLGWARDFTTD